MIFVLKINYFRSYAYFYYLVVIGKPIVDAIFVSFSQTYNPLIFRAQKSSLRLVQVFFERAVQYDITAFQNFGNVLIHSSCKGYNAESERLDLFCQKR